MKQIVDLFYLSPNPYGGWVTFTAHLMAALRSVELEPKLFKVRPRTERKTRSFGYNEQYRNISLTDATRRTNPRLIVAAAKNFRQETEVLLNLGARLVLHDPTELKNLPDTLLETRTVVIRRAGLRMVPEATFIPHPYQSVTGPAAWLSEKPVRAISTSRIDFDKHTNLILDANRIIATGREVTTCSGTIKIHGFENRLYTRFKICPEYPEWEQSKAAYPRDRHAAFNLLLDAEMMVDMSVIKGDGGGTQYTTLEAWDAGAVPVIQRSWIMPIDEMVANVNCLTVSDAEELAGKVKNVNDGLLNTIRDEGRWCLKAHDPKLIGDQYATFLEI